MRGIGMKYYCNPLNINYKYQFARSRRQGMEQAVVYREAADPSLILFKGLYYMFPSMTAGFLTSDDLASWEFHEFKGGDIPVYDYAPDVRVVGDYIYFSASKGSGICDFYRSKDPLAEPFEKIPGSFTFWDPNLFCDDDGRLYFYWGCSNTKPIYGVELDRETMKPLSEPAALIFSDNVKIGYERKGEDHVPEKTQEEITAQAEAMVAQMLAASEDFRKANGLDSEEKCRAIAYSVCGNAPYIEGAWLTKHGGKYYLQYSAPGTEFNIYADGVYVSGSPLGEYKLAKNNPFSYKPGGFINGAGHGSTLEDKNGNFWHTSTMSISKNHSFERRIGLWKAGFDSDGELFCDQRYGDFPVNIDAPPFAKPDFMLLSYGKAGVLTDEDCRTWLKIKPGESAAVDLGTAYDVRAVQINFADDKMLAAMPKVESEYAGEGRYIDRERKYTRWLLEGSLDGETYFLVEDKRQAQTDLPHDFLYFKEGRKIRFLKLTVFEVPHGEPAISAIRVFGIGGGALPKQIENFKLEQHGDLDMDVSWDAVDATGYNILWGYAPDKLYHSYMVFGKTCRRIGALIKGEPVFVRVDAFNENGITEGKVYPIGNQ